MTKQADGADIYRELVDASPVGIFVVHDGRIVFANRTGAAFLGRDGSDITGMALDGVIGVGGHGFLLDDIPTLVWRRGEVRAPSGDVTVVDVRQTAFAYNGAAAHLVLMRSAEDEQWQEGEITVQYKTLMEKLADVVFVIDLNGRFAFLNPGFTRATGYPAEDWIGRRFTELVAPEYTDLTEQRFRAGPPPNGVSQYEIEVISSTGKRLPIEIRVTALMDENGNEIGRIGTARDVSNQRRVEEELRRTNAELDMILNTMGEGVVVLDARHRMVRMNRKAHELFGYDPKEMVGKDYTFWCHPEFIPVLKQKLAERETGRTTTYEAHFLRKGADSFYAQVTAVPITGPNGTYKGSIGCLRDVTHERKLLRRVEELSEFNRRLVELADVWINVIDSDNKVLLWNREAERISGYARAEVEGHAKVWEWLYLDPDYRQEMLEAQKQTRQQAAAMRQVEGKIHTKSGAERIISWRGRPVPLADGGNGWLIVGHDVTEERNREVSLREYAAVIEKMNQERTQLLSMAAHELRTPLTVIRGYADLMKRDRALPTEQRERLDKISRQADRLNDLVTRLLAVARVDAETGHLSPIQIPISTLIDKAVRTVEPMLADEPDRLEVAVVGNLTVYADPDAAEEILLNLLTNAVAYTPAPGRIMVRAYADDNVVRIDVADEGIGIEQEEQEVIFTEFYRTPRGRVLNRNGSGVGLAVVKRLVERSGGKIWVKSTGYGNGSTFSFTLPRADKGVTNARSDL